MTQVAKAEVVLGLGGNKGDRAALLAKAVEALGDRFDLKRVSGIYETAAWGGVAKGDFLNQVAVVLTEKSPEQVLDIIQGIELDLGRKRDEHWGDRTMDIDILYFGEQVLDTERLKVPHPFIAERRFVLLPLTEVCRDKIHPVLGKTMLELLSECGDRSEVKVYDPR